MAKWWANQPNCVLYYLSLSQSDFVSFYFNQYSLAPKLVQCVSIGFGRLLQLLENKIYIFIKTHFFRYSQYIVNSAKGLCISTHHTIHLFGFTFVSNALFPLSCYFYICSFSKHTYNVTDEYASLLSFFLSSIVQFFVRCIRFTLNVVHVISHTLTPKPHTQALKPHWEYRTALGREAKKHIAQLRSTKSWCWFSALAHWLVIGALGISLE